MRGVNERLCIGEVGVDLELYVHAHGPDVELIMEASCQIFTHSSKFFSVLLNWAPCSYGFDHIVLLCSHFSGKFKHLSSADQYPSPTSTLIRLRVLPPGISRLSWNCITSYEFFINYYSRRFQFSTGSGLLSTEDTD